MIDFGIPETAEIHPKKQMKITIEFSTDNAAFQDGNSSYEINKLISDVNVAMVAGDTVGILRDSNGNSVGAFKVES